MKLLARSKEGIMLKIENKTDAKGYTWYSLSPEVLEFSKTIQYGSDLELTLEEKSGTEFITAIKVLANSGNDFKPGAGVAYKCIRCGATLKDGTYKTCYTCSMEIKKELENSPEEKSKQESIKRQSAAHATSRTLIALQGQVDINNITSIMETIYKKYQELIG